VGVDGIEPPTIGFNPDALYTILLPDTPLAFQLQGPLSYTPVSAPKNTYYRYSMLRGSEE
jgi:hypothetical protein